MNHTYPFNRLTWPAEGIRGGGLLVASYFILIPIFIQGTGWEAA